MDVGGRLYFEHKNEQQQKQFELEKNKFRCGNLFEGVVIWVTGNTTPTASVLRTLVVQRGGKCEMKYSTKNVTHIVATNLSLSHKMKYEGKVVVHPNWILDSIKFGTKQSTDQYDVINKSKEKRKQQVKQFERNFFNQNAVLAFYEIWEVVFTEKIREEFVFKGNASYQHVMSIKCDSVYRDTALMNHPEFDTKDFIVSNGTDKSLIKWCSEGLKQKGITEGMTTEQARKMVSNINVIKMDFELYERQVKTLLTLITSNYKYSVIAILSFDEYIVGIPNTQLNMESLYQTKNQIEREIKWPMKIGVGVNSTTALIAMNLTTFPQIGVLVDKIEEQIAQVGIEKLPFIKVSTLKKCIALNITTCEQIQQLKEIELLKCFTHKETEKLQKLSLGKEMYQSNESLTIKVELKRNVVIENEEDEQAFVFQICLEISRLLEYNKVRGSVLTLKIETESNGEYNKIERTTLIRETSDPSLINKTVQSLLNKLHVEYSNIKTFVLHIKRLKKVTTAQIKESNIFQQILAAKQKENSNEKQMDMKQSNFVNPPRASQIDMTVLNALPSNLKNEIIHYYASDYNIYNNPQITFENETVVFEKKEERTDDVELFEIEKNEIVIPLLVKYLKSQKRLTLFHAELVMQYLKCLIKKNMFTEVLEINNVLNKTLLEDNFKNFLEIVNHYTDTMYSHAFGQFIDSIYNS
ncbi:DNA polymerase IV, putative [Entamoeba invadens IP1]|uniref:DNA polymerase IV, putative n=1 Tax=Entamoeba invadens IP1 TaxID=370355 RepID=UPI0002C3D4DD|nr:DNA polymerase IV, putative [Entamoeba invadens IP1]ELP85335.1 DNA polymerase IV, putative [Entamoeba invadens IP1]|eukprot:XP_004184681.1 DNA polymerase IV, putative [Entamoeba invadens IP1]